MIGVFHLVREVLAEDFADVRDQFFVTEGTAYHSINEVIENFIVSGKTVAYFTGTRFVYAVMCHDPYVTGVEILHDMCEKMNERLTIYRLMYT